MVAALVQPTGKIVVAILGDEGALGGAATVDKPPCRLPVMYGDLEAPASAMVCADAGH